MKLGVPLKGHTLFPKQKHLLPASPPISRPNTNLTPTSCSTGLLITSFKGGTCFHQLLLFSINCNCFLFNPLMERRENKICTQHANRRMQGPSNELIQVKNLTAERGFSP